MALMRCKAHQPSKRTGGKYEAFAEPLGYPKTAVLCGSTHCKSPAYIWLSDEEKEAYDRGERVFEPPSAAMKVQAV